MRPDLSMGLESVIAAAAAAAVAAAAAAVDETEIVIGTVSVD